MTAETASAADQIDAIISNVGGWRAETLAEVRRAIVGSDPGIVEEIKWRKPSKPEGVATWVSDGNVCMADLLKAAVRLTFPQGARLEDPTGLFNSRLDGKLIRAIDFFEGAVIDSDALSRLVQQAVAVNRKR